MSWPKARLGTVCKIEKGITGINKAIPGAYPMVVTSEARKSHHEYQFDDDAVIIPLVSSTGHGHKSLKRIHFQQGKFALGSILCAVIPMDKTLLNAEYLYRYLDLHKDNELVSRMKGMANVTLPIKEIAQIVIPLPPINEQIEFTKKYHHLENNSESLSVQFSRQLDLLKKLRQQILQDAVQGKLVSQDNNDEPARVLLQKIKAEKEQLIRDKKIKKEKPLPAIKSEEIPFEIPEKWIWCRLGAITDFISGNNFNSFDFKKGPGVKCVKITNAGVGQLIETEDVLPFEFAERYQSFLVYLGDLVLALTRPYISDGLKISRCTEVYNRSLLNQRVAVIRPNEHTSKEYIYMYLRTNFVLNTYKLKFEGKGQQPNLKKEDVINLLTSIPPLPEQHRIVAKVDQLLTFCDELEHTIRQNQNYTRQLLQVALKEALDPGS